MLLVGSQEGHPVCKSVCCRKVLLWGTWCVTEWLGKGGWQNK